LLIALNLVPGAQHEIQARCSRLLPSDNTASVAQPRGDSLLQGLSWGSPAKTLRSSDHIIASNLRQINENLGNLSWLKC